jgi:hypothetical protein
LKISLIGWLKNTGILNLEGVQVKNEGSGKRKGKERLQHQIAFRVNQGEAR